MSVEERDSISFFEGKKVTLFIILALIYYMKWCENNFDSRTNLAEINGTIDV